MKLTDQAKRFRLAEIGSLALVPPFQRDQGSTNDLFTQVFV
jgi:hypothetical protein